MDKQRKKSGEELNRIIEDINIGFDLDLMPTQSCSSSQERTDEQQCAKYIDYLYWNGALEKVIPMLSELDRDEFPDRQSNEKSLRDYFAHPLSSTALRLGFDKRVRLRSEKEKAQVYKFWREKLYDETWIVKESLANNTSPARKPVLEATPTVITLGECTPETNTNKSAKRKNNNNPEVFCTAPSSPISDFDAYSSSDVCEDGYGSDTYTLSDYDKFDGFDFDFATPSKRRKQLKLGDCGITASAPPTMPALFMTPPRNDKLQTKINNGMIVKKSPSHTPRLELSRSKSISFNSCTSRSTSCSSKTVPTVPNSRNTTPSTSFANSKFELSAEPYPVTSISLGVTDSQKDKFNIVISDLVENGPFSKKTAWFKAIPLRFRYEVERLARACDISPETILSEDVLLKTQSYEALLELMSRRPYKNKIEKSKTSVWRMAVENYTDSDSGTMVVLSGQLEWKNEQFTLVLNPLKVDKSHRFARRFGADRFLEILLPTEHPKKTGLDAEIYSKALAIWLCAKDHHLFGRRWRAFYQEDLKSKSKTTSSSGSDRKVSLFAVDGDDFLKIPPTVSSMNETSGKHTPMIIKQLVDWHIRYDRNTHQEYSKLFARIRLGLSRTIPTITLEPEEFIYDNDPRQEQMSDGCAMMSRSLGRAIADSMRLPKVPACFQESPAGAFKPTVFYGTARQGYQKGVMRSLIQEEADEHYKKLIQILLNGDSAACRAWAQQVRDSSSHVTALNDTAFPQSTIRRVNMLLDAGYLPSKLLFVWELFKQHFIDGFVKRLDAIKIKISKSTYAYCIPDHYGVLEEGEIYLDFGDTWEDGTTDLDGIDVLVSRAPAHFPSDVQKCRAVYRPELRHLKNVAIFSTKGKVPLASLLSGGDYDGDQVWVCWEPEIVKPFVNYPMPDIPKPEEYGLVKVSQRIRDMPFDDFMENSFLFNMWQNPLGLCTFKHEKYCYHTGGIGSYLAIHFSGLLSHLADIRKLGYIYPEENMQKYRSSLGPPTPDLPAYKDDKKAEQDNKKREPKMDNILDFLKFSVIKDVQNNIYARLDKDCPPKTIDKVDGDLTAIWKTVWDRATAEKNAGRPNLLIAIQGTQASQGIKGFREQIEKAFNNYKELPDKMSYGAKVTFAAESLMAIQPPDIDHPLCAAWKESAYEWRNILASCAYSDHPGWFVWHAAFKNLCDMKARAVGDWYSVTAPIYHRLAMNKSMMKKIETERHKAETEEELLLLRSFEEQEILDNDSDDDDDLFSVA
ncbi:RNA directed RNA polymerase [Nannizzia gypsea CBS 118893]|uniref:RNA-dependent RNA polymerase n=1 Tax=Arthroderma gypseum (strain ATCC MYA-4604 / CBS 118893) TaxID=535722 RepID=E4UUQ2_ARTGP|nr:RNA directed RNA polymerase [Nannizzia gypsea CBS 118893]EFR01019.1 RNA directed RNA polymerase [Nannizzia gypsea CBS 118893]